MLSRLIDRAKDLSLVEGFVIGKDEVSVSCLQFADDTLFFASRDDKKFLNLESILQAFELWSG